MLAPFPLGENAVSGGDARALSNRRLFEALGWSVTTVGIYPGAGGAAGSDILLSDPALETALEADMAFGGLHMALAAESDPAGRRALTGAIEAAAPDLIVVEHPWPWPLLRRVLADLGGRRPRLIYSAHNIEAELRPLLYPYCPVAPGAETRRLAVEAMERELAQAADVVLAISGEDARYMRDRWGVEATVLPPISGLPEVAEPEAARPQRYAAMVASAFWPNVDGFFWAFPDGLGVLRLGETVAAAGSVGPAIEADARFGSFRALNQSRFRSLGPLPSADLARVLRAASCVILPVRVGAGANMKTADALWSGRPVVCTPKALVGYPHASPGAGLYVADDPGDFRRLVRAGVRGELAPPPPGAAAFGERDALAILRAALPGAGG